MIALRNGRERGVEDYGWLVSRHTFSFGSYYDHNQMGFRSLRVINDDYVAPGGGFPPHSHANMEILSYVLEGALEHNDNLGNGSVVGAGEFQLTTAGKGVRHSEYNPSRTEPTRFLQIWILPKQHALTPRHARLPAPQSREPADLQPIATPSGDNGTLAICQDASVLLGRFTEKSERQFELNPGRHAFVHVIDGRLNLNGEVLEAGDGAAVSDEPRFSLRTSQGAHFLLFDLA